MDGIGRIIATDEVLWIVDSIQDIIDKDVGIEVSSPEYELNIDNQTLRFEWRIYPKGKTYSDKDWLSAYVFICSSNERMTVSISIGILDNKNNVIMSKTTPKREYDTSSSSDGYADSFWGFPQFVERDFIMDEANGVLSDNTLRLKCKIKVHKATTSPQVENIKEAAVKANSTKCDPRCDHCRLAEFDEFESLVDEDQFSDVSFNVEDKTVRAHKCILAKRSSVFAAMFRHGMKESLTNEVNIEDIKHDIFVEMLRFIYTGKINDIENNTGELLMAADKYSIGGLKTECEKVLRKNLSIDNVMQTLQHADKYSLDQLKVEALDFIIANEIDFNDNPEFELLMEMPKVIFELCKKMMHHIHNAPF